MKTVLTAGVSFTPAARQLDFSAVPDFSFERLFAVVNITRNEVMFGAGLSERGAAVIAGDVLTLEFDTEAFEPDDVLLVIVDDAVFGGRADTPAADDTSSASIVGLLKRGLTRWTTLLGRIPALVSGRIPVDGSGVTQPVSLSALPLPAGAATASLQTSGNGVLSSILTALQAQIDLASTVWTDDSGAYFVRRDLVNEGTGAITVSWSTPSGGVSSGPGAGARPLATAERDVFTTYYDVLTNGTGYSVGDVLGLVTIIDANLATPVVTYLWRNLSTSTTIAAPTAAHVQRADENVTATIANLPATQAVSAVALPLPAGASTSAAQTTGNASLSSIDGKLTGVATDTTLGTAVTGLAAILTKLSAVVIAAGTAVIGKVGLQVAGADVSGSNPIPVSIRDAIEATASRTAVGNVHQLDTTGFAQVFLAITSIGSGNVVAFETSGDGGTVWEPTRGQRSDGALETAVGYVSGFAFPVTARLLRARVSTYGSGTISITATLRTAQFVRLPS